MPMVFVKPINRSDNTAVIPDGDDVTVDVTAATHVDVTNHSSFPLLVTADAAATGADWTPIPPRRLDMAHEQHVRRILVGAATDLFVRGTFNTQHVFRTIPTDTALPTSIPQKVTVDLLDI